MFCENIYHICQHRYNSLNTNNIKTDRYTKKTRISTSLSAIPSLATGTSFHRNRNIIPPQPEYHFSTTGTTFSRHKHWALRLNTLGVSLQNILAGLIWRLKNLVFRIILANFVI